MRILFHCTYMQHTSVVHPAMVIAIILLLQHNGGVPLLFLSARMKLWIHGHVGYVPLKCLDIKLKHQSCECSIFPCIVLTSQAKMVKYQMQYLMKTVWFVCMKQTDCYLQPLPVNLNFTLKRSVPKWIKNGSVIKSPDITAETYWVFFKSECRWWSPTSFAL